MARAASRTDRGASGSGRVSLLAISALIHTARGAGTEADEALRLADYEGLSQQRGAESMQISRATFGRVVRKARQKIADAQRCRAG